MLNNSVPTSFEEWRQYWQAKGFPWRWAPEIDAKRQEELSKCRAIVPDIIKGISPFKGMKLQRADVEWLLATHENGRGPVDWNDVNQREREGLDLRGADLSGVYLENLPLSRLCTRLSMSGILVPPWERNSLLLLKDTDLSWAHLEGANLRWADLEGASLTDAHMEGANLSGAHLERANLLGAHLEGADLSGAHLERANLSGAHLERADLSGAHLERADLSEAHLEGANLSGASLERTVLYNITLVDNNHVGPQVADIQWGETNLTLIDWSQIAILGDEHQVHQKKTRYGAEKDVSLRLNEYKKAARTNRQLAVILQDQGLNEDASRFAYRAQVLQRKVLWKQRNFWKWLGSAILALLAGYGYRMWRILVAYLIIVLLCAVAYFMLGMYYKPHLSILEAVLTSITAFHGRVFSEPFLQPGEPQLWVTAFEAVAGLVIEGVFIAMLTQKFFGK
jgi:uncharacterized protein YjbI with pentapeptide repeats